MKLFKAMATVAGLTGASRILGFVRDILTAAILGAGPIADAFFVALKIPNLFRRVTAEGAFSVAFVPLYSESLTKEGEEQASIFASNAFAVMLTFLVPFTILAMVAMPYIIYAIAPGFHDEPLRFNTAVELTRITFPYLLMMSLTALMGGVLNAHDKFSPFASAPIFFNLCLIVGLLVFTEFTETAGHAMAWGVFAAGVTQFLWLLYFVKKEGIKLRLKKPEFTGNIKKLFKLMGPGVVGAGVMHINLFVDLILASTLASGSISYLYYADRLNQLPLGMVGIAVGTALLPMLSKSIASGDTKETQNLFNRSLEICLLLALPAAIALFVIPETLMSVLFERGAFTATDTSVAAKVLMGYAVGLPAYIAVKVFSTAYWSSQDTMSPVKISVFVTAVNIALSIVLIQFVGVAGIAIATGIVGWVQLALLYRGLRQQKNFDFDARFKRVIFKIVFSAMLMGFVLLVADKYVGGQQFGEFHKVLTLVGLVALGLIVYGLSIITTKAITVAELKKIMSSRAKRSEVEGS